MVRVHRENGKLLRDSLKLGIFDSVGETANQNAKHLAAHEKNSHSEETFLSPLIPSCRQLDFPILTIFENAFSLPFASIFSKRQAKNSKFYNFPGMDNIPVTQETYDQLKQELEQLKKVERPKIIDEIAEARAQGDLSENFAYHAAKDRQGEIESRINYLEDRVARAVIVKYNGSGEIKFGATVKLLNKKTNRPITYTIVSPEGVDAINGKISFTSPIGKALLGKKKGDVAEVITPKGKNFFEILDVQ